MRSDEILQIFQCYVGFLLFYYLCIFQGQCPSNTGTPVFSRWILVSSRRVKDNKISYSCEPMMSLIWLVEMIILWQFVENGKYIKKTNSWLIHFWLIYIGTVIKLGIEHSWYIEMMSQERHGVLWHQPPWYLLDSFFQANIKVSYYQMFVRECTCGVIMLRRPVNIIIMAICLLYLQK